MFHVHPPHLPVMTRTEGRGRYGLSKSALVVEFSFKSPRLVCHQTLPIPALQPRSYVNEVRDDDTNVRAS